MELDARLVRPLEPMHPEVRTKELVGPRSPLRVNGDIRLFTDESRTNELATFFTLRQQLTKTGAKPNMALADFVAPVESGKPDYVGYMMAYLRPGTAPTA